MTYFWFFITIVLPVLICIGIAITIIIAIKKKGKEGCLTFLFLLCIALPCALEFIYTVTFMAEPDDNAVMRNTDFYNIVLLLIEFFIMYALPVLIGSGAVIALISAIKKNGKKVSLSYFILPVISVLCVYFLCLSIGKGGPYKREPNAENTKLTAAEYTLTEWPISDEDLNDVSEACIDYFKNSGNFEFCELTELRYYGKPHYDEDMVIIIASIKQGVFSRYAGGYFFEFERNTDTDKWEFTRSYKSILL